MGRWSARSAILALLAATASAADARSLTRLTRPAILALLAATASAADYRISEVSLLLPPSVEVELSAGPGCGGEWRTTQPEVVSLTPERCEGNVSVTTLQTRAQPVPEAVVTWHAPGGAAIRACHVAVAKVHRLAIRTTTKSMTTRELQWLQVAAEDDGGNAFSPLGLRALRFDWSFRPDGLLALTPPAATQQSLDDEPALAALDDAAARRYYRVAVKAVAAHDRVRATVRGGGGLEASEELQVLPPLLLSPSKPAALMPGATLEYALWKRRKGQAKAPPYALAADAARWRAAPPWTAAFAAPGALRALVAGGVAVTASTADVSEAEGLDQAEAKARVAPPHALRALVATAHRLADAADAAGGGGLVPSYVLQTGKKYKLSVAALAEGGDALLLDGAPKAPAHHHPRLAADSAAVTLSRRPGEACGEGSAAAGDHTCALFRCAPPPTKRPKGADGREEADELGRRSPPPAAACARCHASGCYEALPTCGCAELGAAHVGAARVVATLAASPPSLAAGVPNSSWAELTAVVLLKVQPPLTIAPPRLALPWRCDAAAAASASGGGGPRLDVSGGSGGWTWGARPAGVVDVIDDGATAGRLLVRAPGEARLTATDGVDPLNTAEASVVAVEVKRLRIELSAAEVPKGGETTVTVLFLGAGGEPLKFDDCSALKLRFSLTTDEALPPLRAAGATGGALTCHANCAASPGASCATLLLSAAAAGDAALAVTTDDGCTPPLAASAALSVFVPPPPTTLRVCATAREAAVEEVARFAGAPAGMRRAAAAGDAERIRVAAETDAAVAVAVAVDAGDVVVRVACFRPHAQTVRVAYFERPAGRGGGAKALPTLSIEVRVDCAAQLHAPVAAAELPLGDVYTYEVFGGWAGAAVAVARDAGGGEGVYTHTFAPAPPSGAAAAWHLRLKATAVGAGALTLRAAGGAVGDDGAAAGGGGGGSCAALRVPVRVYFGKFSARCPSRELLVGASMRCYALVNAGGQSLPPTPEQLRLFSFQWAATGAASVQLRALADATDGGSGDGDGGGADGGASDDLWPDDAQSSSVLERRAFSLLVTARSAGATQLRLSTADGTQDVVGLLIREAVGGRVGAAVRPPPLPLVLPGSTVDLAEVHDGYDAADDATWKLCDAEPPFSSSFGIGATLSSDGELGVGAAAGIVCAGVDTVATAAAAAAAGFKEAPPAPQRMPIFVEVAPPAQLRLLVGGDGGGAADFHGELTAGVPTTVCASAFDALGRRFLAAPAVRSPRALAIDTSPAEAVATSVVDVDGWADGACVELVAADHAAGGATLLSASLRDPASAAAPPLVEMALLRIAVAPAPPPRNATLAGGGATAAGEAVAGDGRLVGAALGALVLLAAAILRLRQHFRLVRAAPPGIDPRTFSPELRSFAAVGGSPSAAHRKRA